MEKLTSTCPICAKNNIPTDKETPVIIRVFASKGMGTTVHTKWQDISTNACEACHKKIKTVENTERLLVLLSAFLAIPFFFYVLADAASLNKEMVIKGVAGIIILIAAEYLARFRIKFSPDSAVLNAANASPIFNRKKNKVIVRSREKEFWWLFI